MFEQEAIDAKLLKNCVLFRLAMKCFGNQRRGELSDEAVEQIIGVRPAGMSDEENVDRLARAKKRLKLGKRLISAREYDDIKEFQSRTRRRLLQSYCNQSYIDDGLYTVKISVVPQVEEEIKKAQWELSANLVPKFVAVYKEKIEEAKTLFEAQFNPKDYPDPSALPDKFGIDYRWTQFNVPEGLPPELREQEEKKLRESFERAEQAIVGALWAEFGKFLDHVVDRLEPTEDGKRKKFNENLFENLTNFIGSFNNRNALNDDKLNGLVTAAKEILSSASGDESPEDLVPKLRDEEALREKTAKAFSELKKEVDKTIEEMPERAFDFSY